MSSSSSSGIVQGTPENNSGSSKKDYTLALGTTQELNINMLLELIVGLQHTVNQQQEMINHQQQELNSLHKCVRDQTEEIAKIYAQGNILLHEKDQFETVATEQGERLDHVVEQLRNAETEMQAMKKRLEEVETRDTLVYARRKQSYASIVGEKAAPIPLEVEALGEPDSGDSEERREIEKRRHNIVISGVEEKIGESPRSLHEHVQSFLSDHFCMAEVPIAGVRRLGRPKEGDTKPHLVICTVMDARKRDIILDSSRVYLRGTRFYVFEDRTPKQQAERRRKLAERRREDTPK